MNRILREALLPRVVFLPYLAARIVLFFTSVARRLSACQFSGSGNTTLCIEAGVRGWESIEFKELYQSACEYLQPENVDKLIIHSDIDYLKQVELALASKRITHYLYDPRTGSQGFWLGLWQSLMVAIYLQKYNVVPIVLLTDLSVRTWRSQSAVVSAQRGLVICFMSVKFVGQIFPHRRLLGPCVMPFSVQTKEMLDALIWRRPEKSPAKALFVGSLYEPRTAQLEEVRSSLARRGLLLEIKGRKIGSARFPDSEYWQSICFSDIVVTTSDQMTQKGTDWIDIPHLVYRYMEVLASGALLVAQDVPSVRRYFTPGEHFISFDSSSNAAAIIFYYLTNTAERIKIAKQGKARADALIAARSFWILVDSALGADSMF